MSPTPTLHPWRKRLDRPLALALIATLCAAAALAWAAANRSQPEAASAPAIASTPSIFRADGEMPTGWAGFAHEGATIYLRHPGSPDARTCTLGPILDQGLNALTAGHCGNDGDLVSLRLREEPVGVIDKHLADADLARIRFYPDAPVGPTSDLADSALHTGELIAKHGAATGRTTGTIESPSPRGYVLTTADNQRLRVSGIPSALCAAPGDSGAPVYRQSTSEIVAIVIAISPGNGRCATVISPL